MIIDAELRSRLKLLLKSKHLRAIQREDFPFASLGTLARIRDGQLLKTARLRKSFGLETVVVEVPLNKIATCAYRKCNETFILWAYNKKYCCPNHGKLERTLKKRREAGI